VGDAEREAARGEAGMAMRLVPQASAGAVMPPEAVELQASSGAAGERTALAGTLHAGWSPTPRSSRHARCDRGVRCRPGRRGRG
jgi:hypothetical protein